VSVGGGYLWVANGGDGTITRVDPRSGRPSTLASKGTPTGIAAGPQSVAVAEGPEHSIVQLDPAALAVTSTAPLDGDGNGTLRVGAGRDGIWFGDPAQRILGRVNEGLRRGSDADQISIPAAGASIGSAYERFGGLAVGAGDVWLAGDAFGRRLWRVDPASHRTVASIQLAFVPDAVAVGEGAAWVTSLLGDRVVRIDPATNRIVATIGVGRGPEAIAAGDGAVWVTSSIDDTVSRIDPATNRVAATVPLAGTPRGVAVGAGGVWVPTAGTQEAQVPEGTIGIGLLRDCGGSFGQFYDLTLAGAELALIQRGGRRAGPGITDGIDGVTIGGHPVRLFFGCADGSASSALAEARRLVEKVGVRVLIGPLTGNEGRALQEYARLRPGTTFVNGTASEQELDPAPNSFSFFTDGAEWMAGVAEYAYRQLGWRHAVTIADEEDGLFGWAQAAGFTAEFCSLGGTIAKRIWIAPGTQDYSAVIARIPRTGVDGFVLLTHAPALLALVRGYPGLASKVAGKVIAGGNTYDPSLARLGPGIRGLVTSGPTLPVPAGAYGPAFIKTFPRLVPLGAGGPLDIFYYDAMSATLKALDRVRGDLSGGARSFRAALARVRLDSPSGPVRLDAHHRAIATNYVMAYTGPKLGLRVVKSVAGVEPTFGGYFSSADWLELKTTPACRHDHPPPWAR
jgi:branched-chain amino acid transport system substrate-binding protein